MTRFKLALLLLALLLSAAAGAQEPTPLAGEYKPVYKTPDGFLSIFCNGDLESERAEKLAQEVRAAYLFVRQAQGWRNQDILDQPLGVGVNAQMRAGVWGWARRNALVIGLAFLDDGHMQDTLAHELTHCQDKRQLGSRPLLPHYFLEGRALLMGQAYREKLGRRSDSFDRNQKRRLLNYTWRDAQEVFKEWPGEKEPPPGPFLVRLEYIGGFFLEYLRTHFTGGVGDIQPRTAKIVEDVGAGMEYPEAFHKELGVTLEEAIKAFEEHLWDTQGHPNDRFLGTIWADL